MENVKMIAAGSGHCVALKSDGSVWTWGSNEYGQLGLGYKDSVSHTPEKVMDNVSSAVGDSSCYMLVDCSDGQLYWLNKNAELSESCFLADIVPSETLYILLLKIVLPIVLLAFVAFLLVRFSRKDPKIEIYKHNLEKNT